MEPLTHELDPTTHEVKPMTQSRPMGNMMREKVKRRLQLTRVRRRKERLSKKKVTFWKGSSWVRTGAEHNEECPVAPTSPGA